jgi:hypothetical protein
VKATLLFSNSPNNPVSWLIRVITDSYVSHTAFAIEILGIPLVLEATWKGVEFTPFPNWLEHNRLVESYEVEVSDEVVKASILTLDAAYDVVGLLGYLPVLIGRSLGLLWRNPLASPRATVCSELVYRLLMDRPGFRGIDPEAVTPEDLRRLCAVNLEESSLLVKGLSKVTTCQVISPSAFVLPRASVRLTIGGN